MSNSDFIRHHCDVLVIGGGAAGSMAAIRAREKGADVLLVDKSVLEEAVVRVWRLDPSMSISLVMM